MTPSIGWHAFAALPRKHVWMACKHAHAAVAARAWHPALCAMVRMGRGMVDSRPMRARDEAISADVRAAAGGDGEAYARIIRQYQGAIAGRMTRFSRDAGVVEELVHDVFVEAYFSLSRYRGEAPLEHWLQRIATRVGYRYWKRRERERERARPLPSDVADARQAAGDDAVDEVAALLERLSRRDRLVLTLLYVESRSVAEAAELAGWSQTMVKVQAYRARGRLRKMVSR